MTRMGQANTAPGDLTSAPRLLPTPDAYSSDRGGSQHPAKRRAGGHSVTLQDVTENETPVDWGPYRAAIERAEGVLGRPAPPPVRHDGRDGKARLNPELPEFMMGWPAGWVTNPAIWADSDMTDNGIRNAELKAIGNGVATPAAVLALRHLLGRRGVPPLTPTE